MSFADPFFNPHHHSVDFWSILFSDLWACLWLFTVHSLHHRPSNISKAYISIWVSTSGFPNRNQNTWTSIPNLLGLAHSCLYNAASLCSPHGPSLCSLCLCLTHAKLILISFFHLFYIWYCKFPCYSLHTTHPVTPPLPQCPQVCSLCLFLHHCPAYKFISAILLDSIYMH